MNQVPIGHQVDKNVIYVSDLPPNTIESDLMQFFRNFADKIIVINIISRPFMQERKKNLSAKVIFKDYETANLARVQLNLLKLKGHSIRLMWDERDNSIRYNTQTNLFVKNIPFNISPREVYEHFLQFGDISSAKLQEDINGNHIGYGYVTYYSPDSAAKAIAACDGKMTWGSRLEVKYFQKKTERLSTIGPTNQNIYLTNFPGNFTENDILSLCEPFGTIVSYNINTESIGRVFAIVCFESAESAKKAQLGLNKKNISGYNLFCELYKPSQGPRQKGMMNQTPMNTTNQRLPNDIYRWCNLHIRNIPFPAKEEDLRKAFEQYGPIKSVKIETYNLVTKVKDEFKEIPTSKGFGYVCYENAESATKAKEALNEKFLPGFESWNHPLLIEFFVPKSERIISNYGPNPMMPKVPGQMIPPAYGYQPMQRPYAPIQPKMKVEPPKIVDPIDQKYFDSIETIEDKKEYLGEKIFKLIEEHPLAQKNNMTIDTIGKITGMIINLDDIGEIVATCRNNVILTARINEALNLLNSK